MMICIMYLYTVEETAFHQSNPKAISLPYLPFICSSAAGERKGLRTRTLRIQNPDQKILI